MSRVGDEIDTETGEKIQQLIINICVQHQRVTEFALTAYQGVCCGLKEKIDIKLFGKYIYSALEQEDDEDVTRLAIGVVGDLSLALGENLEEYLSELIPQLLKVLRNQNRDRKTKLQAFVTLADVALYASTAFCSLYLDESLKIMEQAAEVSVNVQQF